MEGNMKIVTAFIGSGRKKYTYDAVRIFLDKLEALGQVESQVVMLADYKIGTCQGCQVCFAKGEEFCPMKDDRDALLGKIAESDGIIFATPNYSFQVSGIMKVFLDRLGFACHRPRYFGKSFTSIVVQGVYGGNKINKYLDFFAGSLGFSVIKGTCHTSLDPMTEKTRQKRDSALANQAGKFHESLAKLDMPAPSLVSLMAFRFGRTSIKNLLNDKKRDYTYYRDNGWFESGFYYPTHMGLVMRSIGRSFDFIASRIWKPA